MGKLFVNGQEVDIRGDQVTAGELKRQLHKKETDLVIIDNTDGLHHLLDHEVIPSEAEIVSIVPTWEFGLR